MVRKDRAAGVPSAWVTSASHLKIFRTCRNSCGMIPNKRHSEPAVHAVPHHAFSVLKIHTNISSGLLTAITCSSTEICPDLLVSDLNIKAEGLMRCDMATICQILGCVD